MEISQNILNPAAFLRLSQVRNLLLLLVLYVLFYFILFHLYVFEFGVTSIFTDLVPNFIKVPAEDPLRLRDFLAALKTNCSLSTNDGSLVGLLSF